MFAQGEYIMKNRSIYHWLIALTGFVCVFMAIGVCNTSFSTVSVYLFDFWNMNYTAYGTMVSVRTFASVIGIAVITPYYKKLSYRWGLALAMLLGAAGWICFWCGTNSVLARYAGSVLLGLCRGIGGSVAVTIILNQWFYKHTGVVIGVCMAASGFAASVMPKILVPLVENYSLTVYFEFIIILFVVVAAFVGLVLRDTPDMIGLQPYGAGEETCRKKERAVRPRDYAGGRRELLLLYVCCVFVSATLTTFTVINSVSLKALGWSTTDIADVMFWFGVFLMASKPIYGFLCDRFRPEYVVCGGISLSAVGTFMMACDWLPVYGKGWVILSFFIWSGGASAASAGFGIYAMDLAPQGQYAQAVKNQTLIWNISNMILSPAVGKIADVFGNYRPVLYIMTGITVIYAGVMWSAYKGAHRNYQRLYAKIYQKDSHIS